MSIHVDTSQFWKYANQTENRGKYFSLKIQPKINFSGEVDESNNFAQKAKFSSEKNMIWQNLLLPINIFGWER